jgi:hypothetical protein
MGIGSGLASVGEPRHHEPGSVAPTRATVLLEEPVMIHLVKNIMPFVPRIISCPNSANFLPREIVVVGTALVQAVMRPAGGRESMNGSKVACENLRPQRSPLFLPLLRYHRPDLGQRNDPGLDARLKCKQRFGAPDRDWIARTLAVHRLSVFATCGYSCLDQ